MNQSPSENEYTSPKVDLIVYNYATENYARWWAIVYYLVVGGWVCVRVQVQNPHKNSASNERMTNRWEKNKYFAYRLSIKMIDFIVYLCVGM